MAKAPTKTKPQQKEETAVPPKYDVRIKPINSDSNVRATVSVTLFGEFAIHGIRINSGAKGLYVSMPCYKKKDNSYHDVCFFSTQYSHDIDCYA